MNLFRTVDAASEALSLIDVKNQLRITDADDDQALNLFIIAIRHQTENFLGKTLFTSTWEYKLDAFESEICLPMGPVQSIASVQYTDTDGAIQTLAAGGYQFDSGGRLKPSYDNAWPATRGQYDAVTITYITGKADVADVPADIKLAMLLWIGACDLNREDHVIGTIIAEIPNSARDMLSPHRNWKL